MNIGEEKVQKVLEKLAILYERIASLEDFLYFADDDLSPYIERTLTSLSDQYQKEASEIENAFKLFGYRVVRSEEKILNGWLKNVPKYSLESLSPASDEVTL